MEQRIDSYACGVFLVTNNLIIAINEYKIETVINGPNTNRIERDHL